jgi:microcystin-dependent protein
MGPESYLGSVGWFAGNFAPKGWLLCDGHQLSIQQNAALFSLLGTTYGGDGVRNFALPDMRPKDSTGRAMQWGEAPMPCICVDGIYPSRW